MRYCTDEDITGLRSIPLAMIDYSVEPSIYTNALLIKPVEMTMIYSQRIARCFQRTASRTILYVNRCAASRLGRARANSKSNSAYAQRLTSLNRGLDDLGSAATRYPHVAEKN